MVLSSKVFIISNRTPNQYTPLKSYHLIHLLPSSPLPTRSASTLPPLEHPHRPQLGTMAAQVSDTADPRSPSFLYSSLPVQNLGLGSLYFNANISFSLPPHTHVVCSSEGFPLYYRSLLHVSLLSSSSQLWPKVSK